MAAVTEEDLNEKRARLDDLRQQIAKEEAKAAAVVQEKTNAAVHSELEIEEQRLLAQLDRAKAETARLIGEQAPEAPPVVDAGTVTDEAPSRDRSTPPTDPDETASNKNKK